MSVRETSLEAYIDLVESGTLTQIESEVLHLVQTHGPMTAGQIWGQFYCDNGVPIRQRSSVAARCTDLMHKGVLYELDKVPCPLTGKSAFRYKYTGVRRPIKPDKKKLDLEEAILNEREECAKVAEQSGTLEGFGIAQLIRNRTQAVQEFEF